MEYVKKVCIVKQIEEGFSLPQKSVSGICRIEREGDETTLFLSLINLSLVSEGSYYLYVLNCDGKLHQYLLGNRPTNFSICVSPFSLSKGFCCGVTYESTRIPVCIAFGKTENFEISLADFKSKISDFCLENKKKDEKLRTENPLKSSSLYDDEAVATENYYSIEEKSQSSDEPNSLPLKEDIKNEQLQSGHGVSDCQSQEKTQEDDQDSLFDENETDFGESQKFTNEHPYYDSAKEELTSLFEKFSEYTLLKTYFPDSKFVKIPYSDQKFYIVGVIKENKKEKYICYGVPENYSEKAPKELEGYCTFIPLSVFDLKGEGFWMMFQDAITGECVKKDG